jgi:hypothetical protein
MVSSGDTGLKDRRKKWADVLAGEAKAQTFKDDLAACEKFGIRHPKEGGFPDLDFPVRFSLREHQAARRES